MTVNQMAASGGRVRSVLTTRTLLLGGVIAPVAFIATFTVAGAVRPAYDPIRHFVSLLSLGDGGWVQVANFLLGGLGFAGFGVGLRRRWPATGLARRVPQLVILTGAALIACGVFAGDPALGYPPGAPAGLPTDVTPIGSLHYAAAATIFVGLAAAMVIASRFAPTNRARTWAAYSLGSAVLLLATWIGGFMLVSPSGIVETAGLLQRIAIVAGWQWVAATAIIELGRLGRPARAAGA